MPPIETIARPVRNRISVAVPREYRAYSFQVILVPLGVDAAHPVALRSHKKRSFVDALLSCPKLGDGDGETLDVSRDSDDYGRDINI